VTSAINHFLHENMIGELDDASFILNQSIPLTVATFCDFNGEWWTGISTAPILLDHVPELTRRRWERNAIEPGGIMARGSLTEVSSNRSHTFWMFAEQLVKSQDHLDAISIALDRLAS
jgi:hypothetical protein